MQVRNYMTGAAAVTHPDEPVVAAARLMRMRGIGALPVCEDDGTLAGMLTDRDIVVRAVASGAGPEARVLDVLSRDALVVRADDDLKVALDLMSSRQIRRLPVVDKDGRLVGVVSLGDLSTRVKERYAGEALEEISRP